MSPRWRTTSCYCFTTMSTVFKSVNYSFTSAGTPLLCCSIQWGRTSTGCTPRGWKAMFSTFSCSSLFLEKGLWIQSVNAIRKAMGSNHVRKRSFRLDSIRRNGQWPSVTSTSTWITQKQLQETHRSTTNTHKTFSARNGRFLPTVLLISLLFVVAQFLHHLHIPPNETQYIDIFLWYFNNGWVDLNHCRIPMNGLDNAEMRETNKGTLSANTHNHRSEADIELGPCWE